MEPNKSQSADHYGVEILDSHQCLEMLRKVSVGHLAVTQDDLPRIFPVNYTVDHGTIVFRTGPGTKYSTLLAQPRVAFEVDSVDPATGMAWSVMIEGTAETFHGIEELVDSFSLMLFPWESGSKGYFVRIIPTSMTGHRFKVAEPLTWWKEMTHG